MLYHYFPLRTIIFSYNTFSPSICNPIFFYNLIHIIVLLISDYASPLSVSVTPIYLKMSPSSVTPPFNSIYILFPISCRVHFVIQFFLFFFCSHQQFPPTISLPNSSSAAGLICFFFISVNRILSFSNIS